VVQGARVKVRGRAAGGLLVASSVQVRSEADVFNEGLDIRDLIANLDTVAQTFSVRGITVFYGGPPAPEYRNGTVVDLANGRRVRVHATLAPDRTKVIATRIDFVNN